ncbi:MAG: hypothetical protein WCR69_02915 [Sulfuricurvum sp.]
MQKNSTLLKRVKVILSITVVLLTLALLYLSSTRHIVTTKATSFDVPVGMVAGKFQDSDCGMVIDSLEYASQVIAPSLDVWFFHDHGGMIKWLDGKSFENEARIFVVCRDTKRFVEAREAFYSTDEQTPMGYGFGAYENFKEGLIDFEQMRLRVLRGESMQNSILRKKSDAKR